MERRGMSLAFLLLAYIGPSASAISIRLDGETSSLPFELAYQTVQSPIDLVLQAANQNGSTVTVMAWQLELELRPLQGTHGTLLFYDAAAPPDGLFGEASQIQTIPELPPPSDVAFVSDADTIEFNGEPVPAHTARRILHLVLEASPDAMGTFQLVMTSFDPASPYEGSSWWDAEQTEPEAFDNSAPSDFPGLILLGTVNIDSSANVRPGDYDRDGAVTDADYSRWKLDFGTFVQTAGNGADGNHDGIIDAADFVIWRKYFGQEAADSRNIAHTFVPEPGILILVQFGLFNALVYLRHWTQKARLCKKSRVKIADNTAYRNLYDLQ